MTLVRTSSFKSSPQGLQISISSTLSSFGNEHVLASSVSQIQYKFILDCQMKYKLQVHLRLSTECSLHISVSVKGKQLSEAVQT